MPGSLHSMTAVLNNREAERLTSDLAVPPPATSLPLNGHETIQSPQTHNAEMAGWERR
jgi:hypothetical protein